jgi:hypothetical protein
MQRNNKKIFQRRWISDYSKLDREKEKITNYWKNVFEQFADYGGSSKNLYTRNRKAKRKGKIRKINKVLIIEAYIVAIYITIARYL